MPIYIRPAAPADEPAITQVRRETWLTAYAQIIDPEIIDLVTAPGGRAGAAAQPDRTSLVAVAPEPPTTAAAAVEPEPEPEPEQEQESAEDAAAEPRMIVGYASYGPERIVAGVTATGSGAQQPGAQQPGGSQPGELTEAGEAGETGELYTLYVSPAHWSTGAGRTLTDAALDGLRADGYHRVVLWTLIGNTRARRFYDKAGFAPDGATNTLPGLGDVEELRYARDL